MDLEAFEHHFKNSFPQLVGKRVLVSLSGGGDSTALLHLLRNGNLNLDLEAAHVHHGVRKEEADRDASFCTDLCVELEVSLHVVRLDPDTRLDSGREATWRRLRYEALLELKSRGNFDAVATGHHRDDVAEGVIVQLLRGGGPRAIAGIAEATAESVVRPLLPWTRSEIRGWLESRGLDWREDSSNDDPAHLRNLVRHRLLPSLEHASPSLRTHLVHLAETLARDDHFLSDQLASHALWIDPWHPDGGVPASAVSDLPAALRTRWLHAQADLVGLKRVTRRQAELFEAMLAGGEPAVTLAGRWRIRRARGMLWLEPPGALGQWALDLQGDAWTDLPLPGWQARLIQGTPNELDPRWQCPVAKGSHPTLRSPYDDDVVDVDGREVRVAKLLSRALPRHLRRAWPVCCENDRIQWIPGVWRGPGAENRAGHLVEVMRRERPSCLVQRR